MEASSTKHMYFEFNDHTFIGEFSTANIDFGSLTLTAKTIIGRKNISDEGMVMKF